MVDPEYLRSEPRTLPFAPDRIYPYARVWTGWMVATESETGTLNVWWTRLGKLAEREVDL